MGKSFYQRNHCEATMHEALADIGLAFELEHEVRSPTGTRWRIDIADPGCKLAVELERGVRQFPHERRDERSSSPYITSQFTKWERALELLRRGWHLMVMQPPASNYRVAAELIADYRSHVLVGTAPTYVALRQHRNWGHWIREEGMYVDGDVQVVDVTPPLQCSVPGCGNATLRLGEPCGLHGGERGWQPGDEPCRVRRCGSPALPTSPHCRMHADAFGTHDGDKPLSNGRKSQWTILHELKRAVRAGEDPDQALRRIHGLED